MLRLRYINLKLKKMDAEIIIPIMGMLTGIIIPLAIFLWQYLDAKGKRAAVIEISKNLEDASKVEELLQIFEKRKEGAYRLP